MFQLGLFTTHLPYILLVSFYLLSFLTNSADEDYAGVQDGVVICERPCYQEFPSVERRASSNTFYVQPIQGFHTGCTHLTGAFDLLSKLLLKAPENPFLIREPFLYSNLSNRPPPVRG